MKGTFSTTKRTTDIVTDSLIAAVFACDEEKAKKILDENPSAAAEVDLDTGRNAMHIACYMLNGPMIHLLLRYPRVSLREEDFLGRWPFHYLQASPDRDLIDLVSAATFSVDDEINGPDENQSEPPSVVPFPPPKP